MREAMEQTAATLQAGRVATGMDTGLHGGHSTDGQCQLTKKSESDLVAGVSRAVLQEASQYQAREEYTTLGERMKQVSPRCAH